MTMSRETLRYQSLAFYVGAQGLITTCQVITRSNAKHAESCYAMCNAPTLPEVIHIFTLVLLCVVVVSGCNICIQQYHRRPPIE